MYRQAPPSMPLRLPVVAHRRLAHSLQHLHPPSSTMAQSHKMKAVLQKSPGGPDSLYVGEADIPQVKDGWLLIKSHATALNRADTMQREGKYPPPPGASQIIGLEVAGEVHEVGQGVTKFRKGDKVMALLAGGGYAEYVAVHQGSVMPIPSHMSTIEAAAIPEAWLTAYQILRYIGKIDKDQTALIHAGAGGVGTAAIQIVNVLGAKSIATAGHADKLKFCKELGASAVINYKDKSFVDEIKEWLKTQDKSGIDVIMDPVGGNHFPDGIEVIKQDGTYVVFAFMGGPNVTLNLQKVMVKRINIIGTTLRARTVEYKADLIQQFTKEIIPAFSNGNAKPIIWKTMGVDQIVEAHKAMDNNENTGKIIITFEAAPKQ